ncbi:MAG: hypothetical protein JST84_22125 [Acidobacteria bacterium]|nr:hypothetical protein [Acidobacteriota bacterium]
MRMMLKASMSVEASNKAIHNGTFPLIMEKILAKLQPEATYFMAWQGKRTMLAFFDLKDASMIPQIAEPLFSGLNAEIDFIPVMVQSDLQKGLAEALAS